MALATITITADAAAGGTSQAPVWMGDSAPAVPANGSLWFSSQSGFMYCYYNDGSSSQWIQVG